MRSVVVNVLSIDKNRYDTISLARYEATRNTCTVAVLGENPSAPPPASYTRWLVSRVFVALLQK